MFFSMKKTVETLFKNKKVIVVTENDEKLGGKLICKPDGTFAIKKVDGREVGLWLSSMRFIGLDGFEVIECKGADGNSSILLENGLPNETRESILNLGDEIMAKHLFHDIKILENRLSDCREKIIDLKHKNNQLCNELLKHESRSDAVKNTITRTFRSGDPFDIENIVSGKIFNIGRSGSNRLFRRDPFEEFAILQQKNGAIGLFSDFWSVYRVG